ncbi:MAG: ATP-binding cassette domain-containing protein [Microbacterium sp.]
MSRMLVARDVEVPGRLRSEPVSFAVERGGVVAVTGPSGSGKTTLLLCAAGVSSPPRGRIARGAERVGVHFQEPRLLPWLDVLRNVLLPVTGGRWRNVPGEIVTRAAGVLRSLGIDAPAALPGELSGGQQRRVSLARALLAADDLLIVDEPFAHLDREAADAVQRAVRGRAESGAAVLLAAHEPDRVADLGAFEIVLGGRG